MRIMGLALTSTAVALTGMLAVGVADPAFAAKKKSAQTAAESRNEALERNPIPNQSAQFYRSSHKSKKAKKPAEDK